MKTCPNCNASLADDAIFCTNCGTNLGAAPAAQAQPQPGTQIQKPEAQMQPQQPVYQQAPPQQPVPPMPQAQPQPNPFDHTAEFSEAEVHDNKIFALSVYALSFIGIIIALLAKSSDTSA